MKVWGKLLSVREVVDKLLIKTNFLRIVSEPLNHH
jgi:hypothetical protein